MKLYQLIDLYKASDDFRSLAPNSQKSYEQMIESVLVGGSFGILTKTNVDRFSVCATDQWRTYWVATYGEAKAQQMCKVLRKIWNWGYRHDHLKLNPWAKMGLKGIKPRTQLWTEDDYYKALTICDKNSLAQMKLFLRLLWATGQRPVDILYIMSIVDIRYQGVIPTLHLTQQKTGKQVAIPIDRDLAADLRKLRAFDARFIRSYHNIFEGLRAQGLNPELQLRDIRRTVATQMAQGGASDNQIRATLGHSGHSKMPETVYTVRNGEMAREGLAKRNICKFPADCGEHGCEGSCRSY